MTRLEFFDNGWAAIGVQISVISPDTFAKYIRYKVFLDLCNDNQKTTAITLAAERNKCSEVSIYRAITFFESDEGS